MIEGILQRSFAGALDVLSVYHLIAYQLLPISLLVHTGYLRNADSEAINCICLFHRLGLIIWIVFTIQAIITCMI